MQMQFGRHRCRQAIPAQPFQRPVQGGGALAASWLSPFTNMFAATEAPGGVFSFLTIMKTVLFTVLVMFLPPLTLAAAIMQAATG